MYLSFFISFSTYLFMYLPNYYFICLIIPFYFLSCYQYIRHSSSHHIHLYLCQSIHLSTIGYLFAVRFLLAQLAFLWKTWYQTKINENEKTWREQKTRRHQQQINRQCPRFSTTDCVHQDHVSATKIQQMQAILQSILTKGSSNYFNNTKRSISSLKSASDFMVSPLWTRTMPRGTIKVSIC